VIRHGVFSFIGLGGRGVPMSVVDNVIRIGQVYAGKNFGIAMIVYENVTVIYNVITNTVGQ
jgi:hypothetical protein